MGSDQRDAWKRALAKRARDQRNRRGRQRQDPPIVGYRVPAPEREPELARCRVVELGRAGCGCSTCRREIADEEAR